MGMTTCLCGYMRLGSIKASGPCWRVCRICFGSLCTGVAVQLRSACGGAVTGVGRAGKTEEVGSRGAGPVYHPTRGDYAAASTRHDVILDIAGNRSLSHLRRALAPEGTLVIVGGEGGGKWFGGIDRQLRATLLSPFVRQKLGTWISTQRKEDLEQLRGFLEAGKVTPIIDRTFPLSEVAEAIRYLREGHARGKIVIAV